MDGVVMAQLGTWLLFSLILVGPIPLAVWLVSRHQTHPRENAIAHFLLSTLTLWCLAQVSLGLILGSSQALALRPVLAIATTQFIAGLLLLNRSPNTWDRVRQLWFSPGQMPLQPGEKVILLTLVWVALVLCDRIATQPFTNYDTLWFHGPIITRWYQTASLSQLDPLGNWIIEHPDAQGYPYNWHVLSVFCLLPWKQDLFAALPMLLAWIMLGLSTYLLSCLGGAQRFYAIAATTLVLSMPFLLNHVTTLHIDLPLAALYTVSLYYLVSYHYSRQGWDAGLGLATAGLMAGVKTPGIIYAAVLITLFLLTTGLSRLSCSRFKPPVRIDLIGLGSLVGLGLGSFWYLGHNLGLGDPGTASLVASTLVDGASPLLAETSKRQSLWQRALDLQSTTLTAQFNGLNPAHWAIFGSQALVRLQLPLVALLGAILLLPYSWLRCPPGETRQRLVGFSVLLLITFFLYWNTPYSAGGELSPLVGFNMRYGFPVLGLLGVVAALSTTQILISKRWVTLIVLTSGLLGIVSSSIFDKIRTQSLMGEGTFWPSQLISRLYQHPLNAIATVGQIIANLGLTDLLIYLGLLIGIFGLYWANLVCPQALPSLVKRSPSWTWGVRLVLTIVLASGLLVTTTGHWLQLREMNRQHLYGGIDAAIEKAVQPGEQIAYFSSSQSYLLYGKHLDQNVLHLPPDSLDPTSWITTLQGSNVALVATGSKGAPHKAEALAAVTVPLGPLTPVWGQATERGLRLYQLDYE
jgi:hypothetical protein